MVPPKTTPPKFFRARKFVPTQCLSSRSATDMNESKKGGGDNLHVFEGMKASQEGFQSLQKQPSDHPGEKNVRIKSRPICSFCVQTVGKNIRQAMSGMTGCFHIMYLIDFME